MLDFLAHFEIAVFEVVILKKLTKRIEWTSDRTDLVLNNILPALIKHTQMHRQTDRHTHTDTHTQRHTHTHTHTHTVGVLCCKRERLVLMGTD